MSISSFTVSGTLKEISQKKFTPSNIPVTNLLLEVCFVPRSSQNQKEPYISQTIRVNAWRDLAEMCETKLKPGDKILVIGRAQINAYTTNDGKKKREIEVDANNIILLNDVMSIIPPLKDKSSSNASQKKTNTDTPEEIETLEEAISNTEEIPF